MMQKFLVGFIQVFKLHYKSFNSSSSVTQVLLVADERAGWHFSQTPAMNITLFPVSTVTVHPFFEIGLMTFWCINKAMLQLPSLKQQRKLIKTIATHEMIRSIDFWQHINDILLTKHPDNYQVVLVTCNSFFLVCPSTQELPEVTVFHGF